MTQSMQQRLITVSMLIVAVIHLLPLAGVMGADKLATLYDVDIADPNLAILMRHRAVLFAILGGFIAWASLRPALQPAALVMAFLSIAAFLVLSFSSGEYNDAIRRVLVADVVAAVFLVIAAVLYVVEH